MLETQKNAIEKTEETNKAVNAFLSGMLEATKNKEQPNEINYLISPNNTEGDIDMKNITLRNDGRYVGRKQINKHIIYAYGTTKESCKKRLEQKIKTKNKIEKIKKTIYLYQWLDEWYTTYKEKFVKYKSALIIQNVINEVKNNIQNTPLNLLTTQQIQNFLNKYPVSRKKEFITTYLNASLQKATDLDIISKNPFKGVVKDKKLNVIREPYNLEEQKTILQKIKGTEIEPVILYYLCTGIRKNELNTKDILKDIDEEHHLLKVNSEKKRDKNKEIRYVDITDELIKLVKENQQAFKLKTNVIYNKFKELLKDTSIDIGIHKLRHTFATNHFYLGTPIKIVSAWLGHEKIELTQNIYTHINRTITKDDVNKLYNNLLFKF